MDRGTKSRIFYVAPDDPWTRWTNSGISREISVGLRTRGMLAGAVSRHDSIPCFLDRPSPPWRWLRWLRGRRPFHHPQIWADERRSPSRRVLRSLPAGSAVLYHYVYPSVDPSLGLRRFLLQDLVARQAFEQKSFGFTSDDPEDVRRASELQRRQNLSVDGTISFANFVVDGFEREYGIPRSRVTAIGCGPILRPTMPIRTDESRYASRRILFVGRNWERKGGPELLSALRMVREELPDASLTVIGIRDRRIEEPGVTQIEFAQGAALEEQFRSSSVFCMPSRCETWGLVYSEAAHLGTPIVGFREWALPDVVLDGKTGVLAKNRTVESLAEALLSALRDSSSLRRMGQAAVEYARLSLDWPVVLDRLEAAMFPDDWAGRAPLVLGTTPKSMEFGAV